MTAPKSLCKQLKKLLADAAFMNAFILPDESWAPNVLTPDVVYCNEVRAKNVRVVSSHFGMCEIRMYLSAAETLVRLPYAGVPGETWREKRRAFPSPGQGLG